MGIKTVHALMAMLALDDLTDVSFTLDKFWVNSDNISKEDLEFQANLPDVPYRAIMLDNFIQHLINDQKANTVRVVKEVEVVKLFDQEGKELLQCVITEDV